MLPLNYCNCDVVSLRHHDVTSLNPPFKIFAYATHVQRIVKDLIEMRLGMLDTLSVANWYIYIPDFTNLVYFLDRLVGEIMVWYMSLNLVYFYAFW